MRLFLRLNSFDFKDIFTQKLTQIKLISTKKQHFSSVRQMGDEVSPQATSTFKTKLAIFKCLKRKRLIIQEQVGNIAKQLIPNGTLNRGEAQSPPLFFQSFPPSFLKTRNHIVKCCFVFYHSFRLQLQLFYPINPSPLKKKIRAT